MLTKKTAYLTKLKREQNRKKRRTVLNEGHKDKLRCNRRQIFAFTSNEITNYLNAHRWHLIS